MSSDDGDSIVDSRWHDTMMASLESVGTACLLALIGVYLHRQGFIVGDGKRTLALISQQVTIPLFLMTSAVSCNQHWDPDDPCPDILSSLEHGWILLVWPIYVVLWGVLVGYAAAKLTGTPASQKRSVIASCAFANSTGLPVTLLSVVHMNFPPSTELGKMDPTLFLSVYLLTYPLLQWSLGSWLLAEGTAEPSTTQSVLNNKSTQGWYQDVRQGLDEADASLYISLSDVAGVGNGENDDNGGLDIPVLPTTFDLPAPPVNDGGVGVGVGVAATGENTTLLHRESSDGSDTSSKWALIRKILRRAFQPPVVGALLGLLIAAIPPVRDIFVTSDIGSTDDGVVTAAPLAWLFQALDAVGATAVPLSMMILGCNLSQSYQLTTMPNRASLLSDATSWAIVIGKLVVMPMVGIGSALLMKRCFDVPADIDASLYLVLMVVFITPTANNVMIMVELSGSGRREGIARVIALQYTAAPVVLVLSVLAVVGIASGFTA